MQVSIMGAAWEDDSTGWIAGVGKDGRVLTGLFYKTTDGGATYALEQVRQRSIEFIFL